MNNGTGSSGGLLSVVVPVHNEQEVLPEFHRRLTAVLRQIPMMAEVVYVNDGSTDGTLEVLQEIQAHDPRVAIIDLSRNFGKEAALTAGLDRCRGDAAVVIDADLQDPPELISEQVYWWRQGYDVVYAQRRSRDGESWFKKSSAHAFYRLIGKVSKVAIPEDTGDFRLLSRRSIEALRQLREQHRCMKGLFAWIGYPQRALQYDRDARQAGTTKWNYLQLWTLAVDGITSFTIAPLKIATGIGLLTAAGAFVYAAVIIYKTLVYGESVAGYPSLMVVILMLGGIQLVALGILGEYLGRTFDEAKNRPLYLVKDHRPAADASPLQVEIPSRQPVETRAATRPAPQESEESPLSS